MGKLEQPVSINSIGKQIVAGSDANFDCDKNFFILFFCMTNGLSILGNKVFESKNLI